ncbi:MAG: TonB-dependent receptor, partial [Pseudomonadota bacterium]
MLPGLFLALATSATSADVQTPTAEPIDTIVVEAAKLPGTAADIPTRVTVIDAEHIDNSLAQSLQDLIRYEPGIDVADQGSRFGFSGFNIRGVSGNRVQIEVDGVANSDAFSIGSFSNASRDFVDISSVKQVEIIRGPASALFGSDAIGGVVSFVTASPNDLLGAQSRFLSAGVMASSLDDSHTLRSSAAFREGNIAGLFRVNSRNSQERDTGFNDPLDEHALNLFSRFEIGEAGNGALDISLERYANDGTTDVDSLERMQDFTAAFGFPYVIDTRVVEADDLRTRSRLSVGQEWLEGKFGTDFLRWRAYAQNSKTRQDTREVRSSVINGVTSDAERQRSFNFGQDLIGLELNAASDFSTGSIEHVLAYGIEFEQTKTEQIRAGIQTNLADGSQSNQVGPDLFPVRDFPKSTTERVGVYLQDSLSVGPVTVNPGLRWDRYELDPNNDSIFADANPGITPVSISSDEVSPKIGLLWE